MKKESKEKVLRNYNFLKEKVISYINLNWKKIVKISILVIIGGIIVYFLLNEIIYFFLNHPINEVNRLYILQKITEDGKIDRINEIKFKFATILGGIGGLILLVVQIIRAIKFSSQVKEERRSNISRETLDQYVKAVEQLKDESITVKLGGIYSLEKIMNSPDKEVQSYHDTIIELLCSYVRGKTPFYLSELCDNKKEKLFKILDMDIHTILTVLGRRKNKEIEKVNINLSQTNLFNANFTKAYFKNAILNYVFLDQAKLNGSHLENANLEGSSLEMIILNEAHLENTNLIGASLKNARLEGAYLNDATLIGTQFQNADLNGTNFENAVLRSVFLEKSNISKANFKNIKLVVPPIKKEETKEDILNFIKELEKARCVEGIQLDNRIMDIIKEEYPDLYMRIESDE
jgi:hypothetical protein